MRLKRKGAFYCQILLSGMFALWGLMVFAEKEVSKNGYVAFTGLQAQVFGGALIAIGFYSLYHLFYRAEKEELSKKGFTELGDFTIDHDEFVVNFKIKNKLVYVSNSHVPAVEYVISIPITGTVPKDLEIQKIRYIDLAIRLFTQNYRSFRSGKIQASTTDQIYLSRLLSSRALDAFSRFMSKKNGIRVKRGKLSLESGTLTYIEGPYDENTRLFDPHRGQIEVIASEMIAIAESIKSVSNNSFDSIGTSCTGTDRVS